MDADDDDDGIFGVRIRFCLLDRTRSRYTVGGM